MKIHVFLIPAVLLALACVPAEPPRGTTTVADTGATIAVTEPSAAAPSDTAVSGDGVQLDAEVSGKSVQLTLRNQSTQPIGYNLCLSALERLDGASWVNVAADTVCTMQLNTLQPAGTATFDHRLPPGLPRGQYRYVTNVENPLGTSQVRIPSDPLTVS